MAIQCNLTDSHLTGTVANAPDTGEPISITTWLSGTWSTTAAKSFVGIYGPSAEAPTTAIQIGSRTTVGSCQVWTWGGASLIGSPGGIMVDGQLHFVCYVFDGGTHSLYVDGTLRATSTSTQIAGQFNTFYINGYPSQTTSETSDHIVESVRMYNRAISAAEVATMWASKGGRHAIYSGLLAYYEFDEGPAGSAATTCYDVSARFTGGGNLTWTGTGSAITYTYPRGESKLRPPAVN